MRTGRAPAAGSGSAAAATASNFTVDVQLAAGIHPGGSAAVTGNVTNGTSTALQLHQVVGDTVPVTVDITHNGCAVADFTVGTMSITGGVQTLAASSGTAAFTGSLAMANTAANQDACQGASDHSASGCFVTQVIRRGGLGPPPH